MAMGQSQRPGGPQRTKSMFSLNLCQTMQLLGYPNLTHTHISWDMLPFALYVILYVISNIYIYIYVYYSDDDGMIMKRMGI